MDRDISGCYTINGVAQALQVWVYTALPELGATFGKFLPNNSSPPILAYKGCKGRRQFKEAILSQTRVINFVQKDTGEMFPKWEFDVEDTLAENIIKLMFVKKPWKWTMNCWEVIGTWVNTKPTVVSPAKKKVVKEDSPRPRKKARKEAPAEASEEAAAEASDEAPAEASEKVTTTVGGLTKEDIKTMFKDIADAMREGFGTCLKEIKYLSERVEAVEKKVSITTKRKGTSSQNTTSPPKPTLEPGSESVNGTNAGRESLAEDKGPDVSAAVPADASSSKDKAPEPSLQSPYTANSTARELADWLKTCPHYRTTLDKKPLVYVEDLPRMFFLDHLFAQKWRFNFKDFKGSEPDQNGLGRRLPVNFADTHWIAMLISIPKRYIVVFDSICSSISPEELDVVMEPFLYMVPYLLVECASSDEQRAQYSLEPFTYERPTNIPPARAGDCGVYTLNYIECHALGIEARPSQICLGVQFDKEV
ncbi:unnamed protein product, partial [Brassica oleracea]